MNTNDVINKYQDKIDALNARLDQLNEIDRRFASFRLFIFISILTILGLSLLGQYFPVWWGLVPIAVFVVAVLRHDTTLRAIEQHNWLKEFYDSGLKRLTQAWHGQGITSTAFVDESHLFARDLDIFGEGSLFELMCTAQTASAENELAKWLTAPSTKDDILERQAAIRELTEALPLREDIALCTRRMRSLLNPAKLVEWAEEPQYIPASQTGWLKLLFFAMGVLAVGAIVLCFFSDYGLAILAGIGILEWVIGRLLKSKLSPIIEGVEGPRRQLKILSDILERFEAQKVESPLLTKLKAELFTHGAAASSAVAQLGKRVNWLEQAKNQVFAPIAFLLMWNGHFAVAIEKWRVEYGKHVSQWLSSVGKLEALSAIAGFAFEHPEYTYPKIEEGAPVLEGAQLGHPLLPQNQCVRNSVSLNATEQVWVVSGSNMSGKSTFLRVVGINAVLAMAGAPICGESMRLTPFAIGSTIRVLDSLQRGTSRFYAEISTLKQIVELTEGAFPLLFLLDEIFHGTNSHDRKIGAQAVVKELIDRGAIGLVTTHDLALTRAAEDLGQRAKNVHFDDTVMNGKLHFDYTLKEGPVTRSNALELMRSVGLQV